MTRELISSTGNNNTTSNCGYSGMVPNGEEWSALAYTSYDLSTWNEVFFPAGTSVNVSQCHVAYQFIGYANGAIFHVMRKYRVVDIKYDCLNGLCIRSTVYNTPGQYDSLEECQSNCGGNTNSCTPPFQCIDPSNFCPPGKVCVPQDEWGQIVGLVQQNISKYCH